MHTATHTPTATQSNKHRGNYFQEAQTQAHPAAYM